MGSLRPSRPRTLVPFFVCNCLLHRGLVDGNETQKSALTKAAQTDLQILQLPSGDSVRPRPLNQQLPATWEQGTLQTAAVFPL